MSDAIEVIQHDEAACDFCRYLNDLKAEHYKRLTTTLMVPRHLLDAVPSTADQERAARPAREGGE